MPKIRVKFFANFREFTGARELEMNGDTIGEVLQNLCMKYPGFEKMMFEGENLRPYINIFLNGRNVQDHSGLKTMLHAGDEIALFPPVSGG